MSKFNYSFERILDLSSKEKETAQQVFAKALQAEQEIEDSLSKTYQRIDHLQEHMNTKQNKVISINELQHMELHMSYLRSDLKSENEQLKTAQQIVQQKQKNLYIKRTEEKKWSTLKENKRAMFTKDENDKEQKVVDDLVGQRYHRDHHEGWTD